MDISAYNKEWERLIYNECLQKEYFEINGNSEISNGKYFSIMMPPPNITGVLHIGHALNFTLQDIIVRYKRMQGYITLWQPGLDHAGIATQNVVERELLKKGVKKEDIGREAFINEVWKWKESSGGQILEQMKLLGLSAAFKRLRFTMDEGLKNAVRETFISWYQKGLIYKGKRLINWCTHDGALSDIEVEYYENKTKLYHIKYFLKNSDKYLVVATTRPETMFGDTAVMIHPDDERYKHLIGKSVILPLVNKEIKIIADEIVDFAFGSGAVKVTPAHDANDYKVGLKHNLEFINIFDKYGILNDYCMEFSGTERLEAREKIVEKLQKLGFIDKIEDYENKIGKCYRCGNIIEPYISMQWFVKSSIAQNAIKRVAENETRFIPGAWINNYNAWMRDLQDWCISRQLWWGHRIPVFYCECGNEFVSYNENPTNCPKCKSSNIKQDEDVLDTWFSSALWSHSTLGFRNGDFGKNVLWNDDDIKNFHPNNLLITGFDILFFWVARMLIAADSNMQEIAFKNIYLHALVCDESGNKMSKSKGNVIDPLKLCEEYSSDILRFSLAFLAVQGRDIRLSKKQFDVTKNFTNKLINAAKFLNMQLEKLNENNAQNLHFTIIENLDNFSTKVGRYMKSRFNNLVKNITNDLNDYRFDSYANDIYKFLWNEFCDNGIELAKIDKESTVEIGSVFLESMKALHPLMPFLSEFLFAMIQNKDISQGFKNHKSIMIQTFPNEILRDEKIENDFDIILDIITSIRRAKTSFENAQIDKVFIKLLQNSNINVEDYKIFICKLTKINDIELLQHDLENAISDVGQFCKISFMLENLDLSKIKQRIKSQKEKITKEIEKLQNMIENENFLKNAPQNLIDSNKTNLKNAQVKLEQLENEEKKLNI